MNRILPAILLLIIFNVSFSQQLPKKHLPAYQTPEELRREWQIPYIKSQNLKSGNLVSHISSIVVPGEFEESQAVLISWPYPYSSSDSYTVLWSKLINAIQRECEVWILVDKYSDTVTVKSYVKKQGVNMYKYRFISKPIDAYWTRDFGPWGFYYTEKDSLGFIDLHYYTSRPNDDAVPSFLASRLGIPCISSNIRMEGGNFMVDGFGRGYYSSRLDENNTKYNGWTSLQTHDTVQKLFNLKSYNVLTALQCDGGTGHIDMYSKLMDEQTLVITQYPSAVTASDKQTIENNVNIYKTLKSTYNRPYKIYRAPMPTSNSGSYYTSCNQIDADARGYTNGLLVNRTYIMPCFSSTSSGYAQSDSNAVRFFRKVLPGYRIVPIDSRLLTPLGGAIHCICMQIPAKNPIRFWHPTVEMEQKPQASWHILARITNKDGIDTALCLWRFKGASEWNKVLLTDSAGYFTGDIPNLSNNYTDTIEYYLDALSNNGKRMSKPITAPRGYYTFWFTNTSSYISGKVYYDNKANSPIERTTVYLTDDIGNIIKTADCDTSGNYRIEGLQNGIYKIYASTASQPGGFDPLDGLLINKYFIKTYTFQDNLCLGAADVNNDLSVNLQDALLVSRRYINLISSFSAGDWLSEKINITINKNNLHQNIRLICFGDVNASYKF